MEEIFSSNVYLILCLDVCFMSHVGVLKYKTISETLVSDAMCGWRGSVV